MSSTSSDDRPFSRRVVIASAIGAMVAPGLAFGRDDDAEIARVRKIARAAKLGEFGQNSNDQYLAIGDAPEKFRKGALEILTGLSRDYLKHFTEKGFAVQKPAGRMTVIVLANRRAFSAYLGEDVPDLVGGIYDPVANDLLLFDNRTPAADLEAERNNTLILTHEATHQLTFSTGLLRRGGDVPKAIAEGLANYAEVRSLHGQAPKIGDVNSRRLLALIPARQARGRGGFISAGRPVGVDPGPRQAQRSGMLPPVARLIADDERMDDPATLQVAYSEAWLLVHYLMKGPKMAPRFKAYLTTIRKRDDPSNRMNDWTHHFGDPKAMDRDLANYLAKLLSK